MAMAICGLAAIWQSISDSIESQKRSPGRKNDLHLALASLKADIQRVHMKSTPGCAIYLMEGATGVSRGSGRPSTDPDENLAIKVIAFIARMLEKTSVIVVPDAASQKNTIAFVAKLGASVLPYSHAIMNNGIIYVACMNDKQAMLDVGRQTPQNYELLILGPGLGYSAELLRDPVMITAMGTFDEGERSTNFRNCADDYYRRIQQLNVHKNPSSGMKQYAVSISEVMSSSSLLTHADIKHWAQNSKEQLLGLIPGCHHLLTKRLKMAGADGLFVNIHFGFDLDHTGGESRAGKGLVYRRVLEQMCSATPNVAGMAAICKELGEDYQYLQLEEGADRAKKELERLVKAHQSAPEFKSKIAAGAIDAQQWEEDCKITSDLIAELGGASARHSMAAFVMAAKNIYDEKTAADAWQRSDVPGQQHYAEHFERAYMDNPGRQIPYDAVVVLKSILDPIKPAEASILRDKLVLIFWAELARPSKSTSNTSLDQ